MANLKKELRLIATLDDAAFKKQLESLKKSMGKDFSFGNSDLSGLKEAFKNIAKDFSKDLKEALKGVSIGGGKSGISGMGGSGGDPFVQEARFKAKQHREAQREQDKLFDREQRAKAQEYFREQRAKEKVIMTQARESEKERRKDMDASNKRFGEEARRRLELRRLDSSPISRAMRGMGFGEGAARGVAGAAEGMYDRTFGRLPLGARMLGGATAALAAPQAIQGQIRGIRTALAQRDQAQSLGFLRGEGLGAMVEQSGRNDTLSKVTGALSGGAMGAAKFGALGAGIGAIAGPAGMAVGGALGGTFGAISGGIKGAMSNSEEEAKARREQIRIIEESVNRAQALSANRVGVMRGGVGSSSLNFLQGVGANAGFSPEETIQQAMDSKQFLGGRNMNLIEGFQSMFNATGADVGLQAQASEVFAGAGGTSMGVGASQSFEIIKKAVAAGLDVSRSGQFLKVTADYVQANVGFARMSGEDIGGRLARSAQGFAGGGEITNTAMEQARSLQEMLRSESTSTSGIAGLGNVMGLQSAFGKAGQSLDSGSFLALSNLSGDASKADVMGILKNKGGMSDEVMSGLADSILSNKQNAMNIGLGSIGGDANLQTYLAGKSRGITTEGQIGISAAQGFSGTTQDGGAIITGAARQFAGEQEQQKRIVEANLGQQQFLTGLEQFGRVTEGAREQLVGFRDSVAKAKEALDSFVATSSVRRTAN